MTRRAIEFYSGYLEDVLQAVGSRDITLVERFSRVGLHTQRTLGLPEDLMLGWHDAVEVLLMQPHASINTLPQATAFASILADAGQRRFRVEVPEGLDDADALSPIFDFLKQPSFIPDLVHSDLRGWSSPSKRIRWGFLDVRQTETLLDHLFGDDSYKQPRTAAIAGRLSHLSRQDAERALIEVGIETQNSVSHNIDYLIIGSKGTGGTKHDKVKVLQEKGHEITVLDEDGFDRLVNPPLAPPDDWSQKTRDDYEALVNALRHVWAFELDLYTIVHDLDTSIEPL